VTVDSAMAPPGTTTTRLLVESNDPDGSPYPGAVYVHVTRVISPAIAVGPASQNFGNIQVGTTADRTFYVTNTGGGTLTGSASVATPFSILSGGSYSLTANQSQAVVVRYSTTAAGSNSMNVSFTDGGGAMVSVSGSAYTPPTPSQLTGMSLSNGMSRFVLNGPVGNNYLIQVSSNLVNWLPLSTNTIPASGWVLITDPSMANQSRRFCRASERP